jgi:23S rRNA (uracil1939-C5)-methyltransferase
MILRSTLTGEWMLIMSFFQNQEKAIKSLLDYLIAKFPQLSSVLYVINAKGNDTIQDLEIIPYYGRSYITEVMEGIKFRISPKAFYQTNSEQAYELYKVAREFAEVKNTDTVYDLYTGTGTIACFVASHCKKVIGIEYVEDAVKDAKANAALNEIKNTDFFAGDMKDILNDNFFNLHGKPDIIITDPPRAGMHEDVCKAIIKAKPRRIVYVSCNASTQARDLAILCCDYKITKVQPVDMFPQTAHIENVVCLDRKL